jgi:hypothetical protein
MGHIYCYRYAYRVICFPLYEKPEKKVLVVAYPVKLLRIFSVPLYPKNGCPELLVLDSVCAKDIVG